MTAVPPPKTHAPHEQMSFWQKYIFSTDHKIIGIQFLFVSLFFLLLGGVLAMQIRWQLGFPNTAMPLGTLLPEAMTNGGGIFPPDYKHILTMHRTVIVVFGIMPLLLVLFANLLIPLELLHHHIACQR